MNTTCAICKKVFYLSPSRIGRVKTCSIKCGGIFRQRKATRKCITCKKQFVYHTSRLKAGVVLYCSKKCYGLSNRDRKNYLWKGKNASYRVMHRWVEVRLGKANEVKKCADCGLKEIPKGMKRYFHWANISRKYLRDVSDYKCLCVKCHKKFDS